MGNEDRDAGGPGGLRHRIKQEWEQLSKSERSIAAHLMESYPQAAFETVQSLGDITGTSGRSVVRLVQKLGYSGFPDLQHELQGDIELRLSSPAARLRVQESSGDGGPAWLEKTVQNIAGIEEATDAVTAAAGVLAKAKGRVLLHGSGKSAAIALYLWHELVLVRPSVVLLSGSKFEVVDAAFDVGSDDVAVVFDMRRYPPLAAQLAAATREAGGTVVVVSDSPFSPASHLSDHVLAVKTGSTFVFDSYASAFALVDLLVSQVIRALPAGRVAARLNAFEGAAARTALFGEPGGSGDHG